MFAKVSVWLIDDLVGDSTRRALCGLSWEGSNEIVGGGASGGNCLSHLM